MTLTKKAADLNLGDVIVEGSGQRTKRVRVQKVTRCNAKGMPYFHINDYSCYWGESKVEVECKPAS